MEENKPRKIILCCLMGVLVQIFASHTLLLILTMIPDAMDRYGREIGPLLENDMTVILTVTVVAPFIEELIFRLLIMGLLGKILPFIAGNLIQAALFGLYHMNIIQGIYAFLLGLLLGLLMEETGTVFACIGFHLSFNVTGLLVDDLAPDRVNTAVQMIIAAVSLAASVLLYLRALKRR